MNSSKYVTFNEFELNFYGIVCPSIAACGFILTIFTFVIFLSADFKEKLYKYLQVEAVLIGLDLFITTLKPMYYCSSPIFNSYFTNYYYIIFIVYMASVLEMAIFLSRIASTYFCFILISNNKQHCFMRISYKLVVVIIMVFSTSIYIFQLFQYRVVIVSEEVNTNTSSNETSSELRIEKTPFNDSRLRFVIETTVFFLRDGLNTIILIVLNFLIFLKIRQNMAKKRKMLKYDVTKDNTSTMNTQTNNLVKKTEKTINKTIIMMVVTCINCLLGRIPIFLCFVIRNFDNSNASLYFCQFAVLAIYLSYSSYFFIYCFTNKRFVEKFKSYYKNLNCFKKKI
jgi:hypothetical protein